MKKNKYLPHITEKKYNLRRSNHHRKIELPNDAKDYIENKINLHLSPE